MVTLLNWQYYSTLSYSASLPPPLHPTPTPHSMPRLVVGCKRLHTSAKFCRKLNKVGPAQLRLPAGLTVTYMSSGLLPDDLILLQELLRMAGVWEGGEEDEEYGLQWDVDRVDLDFKTGDRDHDLDDLGDDGDHDHDHDHDEYNLEVILVDFDKH